MACTASAAFVLCSAVHKLFFYIYSQCKQACQFSGDHTIVGEDKDCPQIGSGRAFDLSSNWGRLLQFSTMFTSTTFLLGGGCHLEPPSWLSVPAQDLNCCGHCMLK